MKNRLICSSAKAKTRSFSHALKDISHISDVASSPIPRHNSFQGRPISAVGYGGFRLNQSSRDSLDHALQSGINVVDTGSHFEKGKSEGTIGSVLSDRIRKGVLKRSDLTLISKSGYLDPTISETLSESLKKSILSNGLMHSIDPLFLERDLSGSLSRLGTEYLDVFMLNNPERLLQCKDKKWTMGQILDSIYKAFEHFKKEIDRGRIKSFGICSNHFSTSQEDGIPISLLIEEVKKQGLMNSFSAIEFPLNIRERRALQSSDGHPSLIDIAHRPLTAISGSKIQKLTNYSDLRLEDQEKVTQDLTLSFTKLMELEMNLMGFETSYITPELAGQFSWAQSLSESLHTLLDNEAAAEFFITNQVRPALKGDLHKMREALQSIDEQEDEGWREKLEHWVTQYEREAHTLLRTLLHSCRFSSTRSNQNLMSLVVALFPPRSIETSNGSLSKLALHFCTSALQGGKGTVLVGMDRPEFVDEALQVSRLPPLELENVIDSHLI